MGIFNRRQNIKPYEYPELLDYQDAIRHAYWLHSEFNYSSDVQDFKVNCSEKEKAVIERTMLAISQIEVAVKTFWGDIYHHMPKPEIGFVGATFAESECRHSDSYSHLLEILGLNDKFNEIEQIPAIKDRMDYLETALKNAKSDDNKEYMFSILLFSIFIEHVSLFSQFLIMSSFDKEKKMFKGISNAIEATSKEEQVHGLFGIKLIDIIKQENPDWFDKELETKIKAACHKAHKAEMKVLDWIFEKGELEFLPREDIDMFVKDKFNSSLQSVGVEQIFKTDESILENTQWFYEDILMTKDNDFFSKRGTTYNKKTKSVTSEDLF